MVIAKKIKRVRGLQTVGEAACFLILANTTTKGMNPFLSFMGKVVGVIKKKNLSQLLY